jgi:hypothetical protein
MRYRFLLVLMPGLCCLGMGKKQPDLNIRFYTETVKGDTDSFSVPVTLLNGNKIFIDQIANVSERDIVAVSPDPVEKPDGSGGCLFKLDDHGTMSLDSLSVEKRGTLLIAAVNGRQVADLLIDKRITDGTIYIPAGLNVDDMKAILKRYPILGGKKATKKAKKDIYSVGL